MVVGTPAWNGPFVRMSYSRGVNHKSESDREKVWGGYPHPPCLAAT